jgi:hypothetical protein
MRHHQNQAGLSEGKRNFENRTFTPVLPLFAIGARKECPNSQEDFSVDQRGRKRQLVISVCRLQNSHDTLLPISYARRQALTKHIPLHAVLPRALLLLSTPRAALRCLLACWLAIAVLFQPRASLLLLLRSMHYSCFSLETSTLHRNLMSSIMPVKSSLGL